MALIDEPMQTSEVAGKRLTPPRCCVAHAWLDVVDHQALQLEAHNRRKHPDQVLAEMVEYLVAEGVLGALLERVYSGRRYGG